MITWFLSNLWNGFRNFISALIHSVWGLGLVVVLVVGSQVFLIFVLFNSMEKSLVKEIRTSSEKTEKIKQNLQLLTQDTGELRNSLGLPNRTYPTLETVPENDDREDRTSDNLVFYKAVEQLLRYGEKTRSERKFLTLFEAKNIATFLKSNNFVLRKTESGAFLEKDQKAYFTFSPATKLSKYEIKSFTGKSLFFEESDGALLPFLERETQFLVQHFANLAQKNRALQEILQNREFQETAKGKNLFPVLGQDSGDSIFYSLIFKKERSNPKLRFGLDKKKDEFFVDLRTYRTEEDFRKGLLDALKDLDLRSLNELKIDELKKQILSLTDDKGFRSYLESKKLKFSSRFREDGEYSYFDFLDENGKKRGSLGIHKIRPEIYLLDEDGVSLGALKTLNIPNPDEIKKKSRFLDVEVPKATSLYRTDLSRTYLFVGTHENLTDTLMLAHINESKNSVVLISIPRDLYYNGRKINTLYPLYGGPKFTMEISQMTGLSIDRYIVIDMFAFIDVVNILGGIDLTLEEDLIDPTYRIKEGGRWSTLFYKAGQYHFNGIETLRIARSRHFSSDFNRARRQQEILESIKAKLSTLGIKDLGKIYDLVKLLQKYVDTDMTSLEIANSLLKYSDIKVANQYVLDTSNILYNTYRNLLLSDGKSESNDKPVDRGAYILLPKGNDWNNFRRYIRTLVEG